MTAAMSAVLSEVAGTRMYTRNAFRLVELPTNATRRQILERKQRITTMHQVDPDLVSQDVLGAFDRLLGDPRRRLVDEIFWFWDGESTDCGCSVSLHKDHDKAVRAHFEVMQRETKRAIVRQTGEETQRTALMWSATAELWGKALRRAALWDHVRHRIAALNDRQLDESVIDVLRSELPTVLVKPLIQFAGSAETGQQERAETARRWPVPSRVVDDLLEDVAAPAYETVDDATSEAHRLVEAGDPSGAVRRMEELAPTLRRMNALAPPDRHRRTADASNSVATVYNNCALALAKREGVISPARTTSDGWLDSAREFATSPRTIETIEQNRRAIDEIGREITNLKHTIDRLMGQNRWAEAYGILDTLRQRVDGELGGADLERMFRGIGLPGARVGWSPMSSDPNDAPRGGARGPFVRPGRPSGPRPAHAPGRAPGRPAARVPVGGGSEVSFRGPVISAIVTLVVVLGGLFLGSWLLTQAWMVPAWMPPSATPMSFIGPALERQLDLNGGTA